MHRNTAAKKQLGQSGRVNPVFAGPLAQGKQLAGLITLKVWIRAKLSRQMVSCRITPSPASLLTITSAHGIAVTEEPFRWATAGTLDMMPRETSARLPS